MTWPLSAFFAMLLGTPERLLASPEPPGMAAFPVCRSSLVHECVEFCVLQEDDGLAIDDLAVGNHLHRFVNPHF